VRSGYSEAVARDLRERLDPFIRKDSPLAEPVKKPKATWVQPVIEADIAYSTVTENNLPREPCSRDCARIGITARASLAADKKASTRSAVR